MILALLSGALLAALATGVRADDPVSSSVRFNREIIRILQRRCLSCHVPGSLAMPLSTYRDVREWSRAIREEIVEQRMPPSTAAPGYGRFENPLGLTSRETATLLTWLDGGMPRGDERDLPASIETVSSEPQSGPADVRLELPEQTVPAFEDLVIRRVTIDPRLALNRQVSHVAVRPGSRAVLRGALVYSGPGERSWVGAWLPWQHVFVSPTTLGFALARGETLSVVLYYRGGDATVVDRSAVELYFAREPRRSLDSLVIETSNRAPGAEAVSTMGRGQLTLRTATTVWALQPAIGAGTLSAELRAERPDGAIEVLFWMPTVRPEWPNVLVLQRPVAFPAGTVLSLSTRRADPSSAGDRVILSGWRDGR